MRRVYLDYFTLILGLKNEHGKQLTSTGKRLHADKMPFLTFIISWGITNLTCDLPPGLFTLFNLTGHQKQRQS